MQRANLHSSLVQQLRTDIHLPACVRVMGFLRRIQRHSEEELRSLFIEHRRSFLEGHKQQVELLRGSRGSVVTALRNAADLLRTHVYDVGTQYKALFPQEDGPLGTWLSEQIAWLTGLLRAHLLPPRSQKASPASPQSAGASVARSPAAGGTLGAMGGWGHGSGVRIDATSLATILRQCHIASSTLKRLGGYFFPAIAGIFEARMEHHVCELLDVAVLTFHAELGRYDWIPSTALAGGTPGTGAAGTAGAAGAAAAAGGPNYLHPQALELTRHRPLAVFTNDIVQVFNELRQCTLYGLRAPVVLHCSECLSGAVNLLRSVLASQAFQAGSNKAAEFARLCKHFAHILVPLVAAHLEAVFGTGARLDSTAIVESMVPDLLPAASPEYPLPADGGFGEIPMEEELATSKEPAMGDSGYMPTAGVTLDAAPAPATEVPAGAAPPVSDVGISTPAAASVGTAESTAPALGSPLAAAQASAAGSQQPSVASPPAAPVGGDASLQFPVAMAPAAAGGYPPAPAEGGGV